VIVENAGYGSTYAAPIASYMTEKYLIDSVSKGRQAQVEWMKKQVVLPLMPKPKVKYQPKATDTTQKQLPAKLEATPINDITSKPKPIEITK
jgi:penicillin-binding protein 2